MYNIYAIIYIYISQESMLQKTWTQNHATFVSRAYFTNFCEWSIPGSFSVLPWCECDMWKNGCGRCWRNTSWNPGPSVGLRADDVHFFGVDDTDACYFNYLRCLGKSLKNWVKKDLRCSTCFFGSGWHLLKIIRRAWIFFIFKVRESLWKIFKKHARMFLVAFGCETPREKTGWQPTKVFWGEVYNSFHGESAG